MHMPGRAKISGCLLVAYTLATGAQAQTESAPTNAHADVSVERQNSSALESPTILDTVPTHLAAEEDQSDIDTQVRDIDNRRSALFIE